DVFRGEFTANVSRPDVGAAHPAFGNNHGFDITVPVAAGQRKICVFAINAGAGSVDSLIGCRTIDVGSPVAGVDSIGSAGGGLRVKAWPLDPDTTGPIQLHPYVAGSFRGAFTADQPRPDIAAFFPDFGP